MSMMAFVAVSILVALPFSLIASMALGAVFGTSLQSGILVAVVCYGVAALLGVITWRLP
jgi:hypothetical protein